MSHFRDIYLYIKWKSKQNSISFEKPFVCCIFSILASVLQKNRTCKMCAHVHVGVYVCVHVCTLTCAHVCLRVCMYICKYTDLGSLQSVGEPSRLGTQETVPLQSIDRHWRIPSWGKSTLCFIDTINWLRVVLHIVKGSMFYLKSTSLNEQISPNFLRNIPNNVLPNTWTLDVWNPPSHSHILNARYLELPR